MLNATPCPVPCLPLGSQHACLKLQENGKLCCTLCLLSEVPLHCPPCCLPQELGAEAEELVMAAEQMEAAKNKAKFV